MTYNVLQNTPQKTKD